MANHRAMRIEGPKPASELRKSEKTRKSGGVSGAFGALLADEAEESAATGSAPMVSSVGSLLAAQSVEDPTERKARKRMMERADKVLDALNGIHRGLVSNTLTAADLSKIAGAVAERREKINDPKLLGILDEVDLRAQVEMAKLEMAREKAKI